MKKVLSPQGLVSTFNRVKLGCTRFFLTLLYNIDCENSLKPHCSLEQFSDEVLKCTYDLGKRSYLS